jgi:hypothetical protein
MCKADTRRVEVKTKHVTVIKYAAFWENCTCCAIFSNIVCFTGDRQRSLQDMLQLLLAENLLLYLLTCSLYLQTNYMR